MAAVPNTAPGAAHTLIERIFRHVQEFHEVAVDELPKAFAGEVDRCAFDYALQGLLNSNRLVRTLGVYKLVTQEPAPLTNDPALRASALARKQWLIAKAGEIAKEIAELEAFLVTYDRLAKEGA